MSQTADAETLSPEEIVTRMRANAAANGESVDYLRALGDVLVYIRQHEPRRAEAGRARWVAEALESAAEQIAERCGHRDYRERGTGDGSFEDRWREPKIWPPDRCPFCSKDTELVRVLAAEYRGGAR